MKSESRGKESLALGISWDRTMARHGERGGMVEDVLNTYPMLTPRQ